jgi:hypothetical protein
VQRVTRSAESGEGANSRWTMARIYTRWPGWFVVVEGFGTVVVAAQGTVKLRQLSRSSKLGKSGRASSLRQLQPHGGYPTTTTHQSSNVTTPSGTRRTPTSPARNPHHSFCYPVHDQAIPPWLALRPSSGCPLYVAHSRVLISRRGSKLTDAIIRSSR